MNISDFTNLTPVGIAYRVIFVLIAIIGYFITYFYGVHQGELKNASKDAIALNKAIQANDLLKSKLEKEHDEAQDAINVVMGINPPPVFVRLAPRDCKPVTALGGESANDQSDVLSGEIERILDSGRQRIKGIVADAEKELNGCHTVQKWAKSLK